MIQLIYTSVAAGGFQRQDLVQLLKGSRERNAKRDLTGMLVYDDGSFLQVLEGPESAVMSLFERIKGDPRHEEVLLLSKRPIDERAFSDWEMGFVDVQREVGRTEGFSGILMPGFSWGKNPDDGDRARKVLEGFKQGRFRRAV